MSAWRLGVDEPPPGLRLFASDMSNRIKTDFLTPASSFLSGFGSVLNIGGDYFGYNYSESPEEADEVAIASDWAIVGEDLRAALSEALSDK
jgi:hypothetical protein